MRILTILKMNNLTEVLILKIHRKSHNLNVLKMDHNSCCKKLFEKCHQICFYRRFLCTNY